MFYYFQRFIFIVEHQEFLNCLPRWACVALVSTLCSGGAASTSSMADPASFPLAAVSVSASNSRHSTRKRVNPTQPQVENKRPRTRSQDTATVSIESGGRGKIRTNSEAPITRNSKRVSKNIFDKIHSPQNSKLHNISRSIQNSLEDCPSTSKNNKGPINCTSTVSVETQRKDNRKAHSTGNIKKVDDLTESSIRTRRQSKVEAGTSVWEVSSTRSKSKIRDNSNSKPVENESSSIHNYPLRSQVRRTICETEEKCDIHLDQGDSKFPNNYKKKNKVSYLNVFILTKIILKCQSILCQIIES